MPKVQHLILTNPISVLLGRLKDYAQLFKLRLSAAVVFSTGIGYALASNGPVNWSIMLLLLAAGFLVTAAANGINQVIEKDIDKLMIRTSNRPVASGRISAIEAIIVTSIMGVAGATLLTIYIGGFAAFLAIGSLILYAFLYTPLKRITSFAVVVGAIPGATAPVIGYVAAGGTFDTLCIMLFSIQFIWQLPHFWAIAWVCHEDYQRAGFQLLPFNDGKSKMNARAIFLSTLPLIPMSLLLISMGLLTPYLGLTIIALSLLFAYQGYLVAKAQTMGMVKTLMFSSFIYLPLVQWIMVMGKI